MEDNNLIVNEHFAAEVGLFTWNTFVSGTLLITLCMNGLNNYTVVQVIQAITYVYMLTDSTIPFFRFYHYVLETSALMARMSVAIYMLVTTTILLLLPDKYMDENGNNLPLERFGFDEDRVYLKSDTWFVWRLISMTQFVIWLNFLATIRIIGLLLRLLISAYYERLETRR